MKKLATKFRRFVYHVKHDWLSFQNVVLAVAIAFCLLWAFGAISSMSRNWELAEEVMNREHEKTLLSLEVETLELENSYYQSEEYQELAARKYQNKKLPGETLIYLPPNSEAAIKKYSQTTEEVEVPVSEYRNNFDTWMKFLFGN